MTTCGCTSRGKNIKDGVDSGYSYKSLCPDCKEFRLLDVQPAETYNTLVQCSLRHASLKDERNTDYETISYVWGDAHERETLNIDGKTYEYSASSVAAIRRLRFPNAVRTIWIDAICIDQGNLEERAQQVALMGDIYRESAGNLVYLGHCEDEHLTRLALRDIQSILQEMNKETDNLNKIIVTPTKADSGMQCSVDFDQLLRCLFSHPWFSRLWIVQEAVLAPSNTCFLGPFQFDLLDLLRAAKWLRYKELYVPSSIKASTGIKNAWIMWEMADKPYGPHASFQLMVSHLLEKSRDFETSVPVDKVYGMLGLKKWFSGIPRLLQPDYRRPYHEVVRDAMRFSLQEYKNGLWLWKNISITSDKSLDEPRSPTWVLNLERWNPAVHPVVFCNHHFSCANAHPQPWPEPKSECIVDLDVLEISGFELCAVEQTMPELTGEIWGDTERQKAWIKDCMDLIEEPKDKLAAATLLIGGTNAQFDVATTEDIAAWQDFKTSIFKQNLTPVDEGAAATKYGLALLNTCARRRVFRTTAGYKGVGSKITARGDVVAMLHGGRMPYILRPTEGGKYRFLGECYVQSDDVMFGNQVKKLQERSVPSVIFRII